MISPLEHAHYRIPWHFKTKQTFFDTCLIDLGPRVFQKLCDIKKKSICKRSKTRTNNATEVE